MIASRDEKLSSIGEKNLNAFLERGAGVPNYITEAERVIEASSR